MVARDREEQRRAQSLTAAEHLRGEPPERRDRRDAEQDGREAAAPTASRPNAAIDACAARLKSMWLLNSVHVGRSCPAGSRTYFTSVTISSYERHESEVDQAEDEAGRHETREHEPRTASRCAARRVVHHARSGRSRSVRQVARRRLGALEV